MSGVRVAYPANGRGSVGAKLRIVCFSSTGLADAPHTGNLSVRRLFCRLYSPQILTIRQADERQLLSLRSKRRWACSLCDGG